MNRNPTESNTGSTAAAPADRLLRGHLPEQNLRFAVCQGAGFCGEAIRRHQADWISGWLLSEALACAALLSVTLKEKEKLTLRWGYPGPVGTILTDTNELGEVRGFPQALTLAAQSVNLEEAIGGEGRISAITSLPNKVLHTGITPGVFRDVPRDMAHLFSLSFQVETVLTVGLIIPPRQPVAVQSAIGIMVQPLPGADLMELEAIRQAVEGRGFRDWLEGDKRSLREVIERLSKNTGEWRVLGEIEPSFACGCTRGKVKSVLQMFETLELEDMLEKEGMAEVICHFCAESYRFEGGELETMIRESKTGNA